jgi:hypothetical protein
MIELRVKATMKSATISPAQMAIDVQAVLATYLGQQLVTVFEVEVVEPESQASKDAKADILKRIQDDL